MDRLVDLRVDVVGVNLNPEAQARVDAAEEGTVARGEVNGGRGSAVNPSHKLCGLGRREVLL
ncbi:MAG: hypothetical protein ACOYD4_05355 [Solirubrobacterales bacterium]